MNLADQLATAVREQSDLLTVSIARVNGAPAPLQGEHNRLDYSLDGTLAVSVRCTPVDCGESHFALVVKLPLERAAEGLRVRAEVVSFQRDEVEADESSVVVMVQPCRRALALAVVGSAAWDPEVLHFAFAGEVAL